MVSDIDCSASCKNRRFVSSCTPALQSYRRRSTEFTNWSWEPFSENYCFSTLNHLQLRASNLGLGLSWQGLTAHTPRTFLIPNDCSHLPPRSINPGQRHILQHDYLIPDTSSRIAAIKSSPAVELGQSGTYCGRLRPFCDDISRKHRKCRRLVGTRSHLIWLKVALVAQNSTGKPVS